MRPSAFHKSAFVAFFIFMLSANILQAQDSNFPEGIAAIEQALLEAPADIRLVKPIRFEDDPAKSGMFIKPDSTFFRVKLMSAAPGGHDFNNEPRYEAAAYHFQKLFLDPADFLVPPTAIRSMPLADYRKIDPEGEATFYKTHSVVLSVQYWLQNATADNVYDKERLATDSLYARYLGNFNIFTYLIDHKDANPGNYLISKDKNKPVVFSVDNGVAFDSDKSNRGYQWRSLQLKRFPASTIDRLREIRLQDLEKSLGVVAQFAIKDGYLVNIKPEKNIDAAYGVRKSKTTIQFGLTQREILNIHRRIEDLLKKVANGKIEIY